MVFGAAFYEFLSFLKAETGDFTNDLDNVELLSAEGLKNYVEFCLSSAAELLHPLRLLPRRGSCCGYAEFLFCFYEGLRVREL